MQRVGEHIKPKSYVPSIAGFARLSSKLSERIMARLFEAQAEESNVHLRDDYRIASKTVFNCYSGIPDAWETAFREYLGAPSSRLIPFFVKRAEWWQSEDLLANAYPEVERSSPVRIPRLLKLIVARMPQAESGRVIYYVEKLECGHEYLSYESIPSSAKRRNCSTCAVAELRSVKKPPQSVREVPKRGRKSA